MGRTDRAPAMLAGLSTVLGIIGGLATAPLGPAFVWRFELHRRPGGRVGLWFGVLAAAPLAELWVLAVVGGVRRLAPELRGHSRCRGIVGLIVLVWSGRLDLHASSGIAALWRRPRHTQRHRVSFSA